MISGGTSVARALVGTSMVNVPVRASAPPTIGTRVGAAPLPNVPIAVIVVVACT